MYREGGGPPPYEVAAIEPERALILGHRLLGGNTLWGDRWAFVLQKIDERSTRLITHARWGSSLPTSLHVMNYILQPGYFIMYRKMLLGIKERGCLNEGHQMGNPLMRRAARATVHTSCTSHSSFERRLLPHCLVVKSNHPCLERLCFEQLQLRRILDVLKERDST